jgi:hypothetical protein
VITLKDIDRGGVFPALSASHGKPPRRGTFAYWAVREPPLEFGPFGEGVEKGRELRYRLGVLKIPRTRSGGRAHERA